METQTYIRKPLIVQAVQITLENIYQVAEWCGGLVQQRPGADAPKYVKVNVLNPVRTKQEEGNVGDWVLQSSQGFKVYTDKAFGKGFERSLTTAAIDCSAAFPPGVDVKST